MKIRKDDILVWEDGGEKDYYLHPDFPDFEDMSPEAAYINGFYCTYLPEDSENDDSESWTTLPTFELWDSDTRPALATRWYKSRWIPDSKPCKQIWAWRL